MASESTTSTAATAIPPVETPLTQEQEKYIKKFEDEILPEEKKILEKGTLMPTERAFFKKNVHQKDVDEGAYESLYEMMCNINDGRASKEIENFIFKNMMEIMLREFNASKKMIFC